MYKSDIVENPSQEKVVSKYCPPLYSEFKESSKALKDLYGSLTNRYNILIQAKDLSDFDKLKNALSTLISRIDVMTSKKTDRDDERKSFVVLSGKLKGLPTSAKSIGQLEEAIFILLGSLFHRYNRLYLGNWSNPSLFKYPRLLFSIREALGLTHKFDFTTDLKLLDPVTFLDSLVAFKSFMTKETKKGIPDYKSYPHISTDVKFISHLDEIILENVKRSKELYLYFSGINFIQSLLKQIDKEVAFTNKHVTTLFKTLKENLEESTKLTSETIEKTIDSIEFDRDEKICKKAQEVMFGLLATKVVQVFLKEGNAEISECLEIIKEVVNTKASFWLAGAYVIVREPCTIVKKEEDDDSKKYRENFLYALNKSMSFNNPKEQLLDTSFKTSLIENLDLFLDKNHDLICFDYFKLKTLMNINPESAILEEKGMKKKDDALVWIVKDENNESRKPYYDNYIKVLKKYICSDVSQKEESSSLAMN